MGIPYADQVMNAVVLTAVLSCLNSGMYTASRMLFVLAARREAPAKLVEVNGRGVPVYAILLSAFIGLLCVIAAAFSPDTIFAFLLNSSGAIILFVYLFIVVSQIVLRYRTPDGELRLKMWLFPVLSLLTGAAIVAILVQMYLQNDLRSQLVLSLLAFAAVLVVFLANNWFIARRASLPGVPASDVAHRVLVLANDSLGSAELHATLRQIGATRNSVFRVVVPLSPVETGVAAAQGPLDVWEATRAVAVERLGAILGELHAENLTAEGVLGDQSPREALAEAVEEFLPDQIVIATPPPEDSVWQHYDVVDRARAEYGVPVTHVVCAAEAPQS